MPSPFSTKTAAAAAATTTTGHCREFIVHSQGEDGYVEVTSTDTLSEVRRLILEDFDPEQLPSSSSSSPSTSNGNNDIDGTGEKVEGSDVEFAFRVDGIRISAKQEGRKNAFELLERKARIELVPKRQQQLPMKRSSDQDQEDVHHGSVKRARMTVGESGTVTPFEPSGEEGGGSLSANDAGAATATGGGAGTEDDSSTIATKSTTGGDGDSVMAPVKLDSKFAVGSNTTGSNVKDEEYDSEATTQMDLAKKDEVAGMDKEINETGTEECDKLKTGGFGDAKSGEENQLEELDEGKVDGKQTNEAKPSEEDNTMAKGSDDKSDKEDLTLDVEKDSMDLDLEEGTSTINDNKKKAADDSTDTQLDSNDHSTSDGILEISNEEEEASPEYQDPHKESDSAKDTSKQVLSQLSSILKDNPDFCAENRRKEWLEDIHNLMEKSTPQTVFGVLGNTGVGKSSLLNSLLDEAAVLPTSGSRGCTAAVVELVYNSDLMKEMSTINDGSEREGVEAAANEQQKQQANAPVYRGEVEFITLEDWRKELKVLVDECSTQEKTIYARCPEESQMPDAAQAWQKIEQVYGRGAMEQYRRASSDRVFHSLAHNLRVKNLLTATTPGRDYNSIVVEVGEVVPGSEDAKELLKAYAQQKSRTKGKKKKWAQEFRKQINSYVYRMGNGDLPQTWPLIRKVQLKGPWSVLSTGAVLVDLPGVRDSNAARAKVAESYLANCNQIAIVAPIKRAVDDGTAKELLGEQFKRRLLMDGNYGNVFFICTQTDDIEATETMRDHADVAQEVPGRWEKMTELSDGITSYEKQLAPFLQQEEDLEGVLDDARQQYNESLEDLKQAKEEMEDDLDDDEVDTELFDSLNAVIADNKSAFVEAKQNLTQWREEHSPTMVNIQGKCDRMQKRLKALCSTVRNEYSKQQLQADFKSGLKELYRKDDDDGNPENDRGDAQTALPDEFNMDVFCISANDYLKILSIKPRRDGPPSTFSNAQDTQVPQLRKFVHEVTARFCKSSVKTFVENTNDLLDQMKLLAGDVENVPTGRMAFRMKTLFETAMRELASKISPISRDFEKVMDQKIQVSLSSSLRKGAKKGSALAMHTVNSWGSKSRRTKSDRRPDKNGLHYSTYNAVVKRDGVYTSGSAGAIDFNQELCDPMEKEFSTEWQAVLDGNIRRLLSDAEKNILQLCTSAGQSFAQSLRNNGVDAARLSNMLNTANRSAISALKASFSQMNTVAVNVQREISRELLPAVQEKMKATYQSANSVERGCGTFMRMKGAMHSNSQRAVNVMFDDAMRKLLAGIQSLIKRLKAMIDSTSEVVGKVFQNVFSICWDDQQSEALVSPEMLKTIRECRDKLLPELNELVKVQGSACDLLGIVREEVELDVVGVETFEQTLARKKEEAKKNGDMFDLCDSDAEVDIQPKKGVKVKAEKRGAASSSIPSHMDVIDLCDSDNEDNDDDRKPAASKSNFSSVKEEAFL